MFIAIVCLFVFILFSFFDLVYLKLNSDDPIKSRISLMPLPILALPIIAILNTDEVILKVISVFVLVVRDIAFQLYNGKLLLRIYNDYKREKWGDD